MVTAVVLLSVWAVALAASATPRQATTTTTSTTTTSTTTTSDTAPLTSTIPPTTEIPPTTGDAPPSTGDTVPGTTGIPGTTVPDDPVAACESKKRTADVVVPNKLTMQVGQVSQVEVTATIDTNVTFTGTNTTVGQLTVRCFI